jgi:hypothetical protein
MGECGTGRNGEWAIDFAEPMTGGAKTTPASLREALRTGLGAPYGVIRSIVGPRRF